MMSPLWLQQASIYRAQAWPDLIEPVRFSRAWLGRAHRRGSDQASQEREHQDLQTVQVRLRRDWSVFCSCITSEGTGANVVTRKVRAELSGRRSRF